MSKGAVGSWFSNLVTYKTLTVFSLICGMFSYFSMVTSGDGVSTTIAFNDFSNWPEGYSARADRYLDARKQLAKFTLDSRGNQPILIVRGSAAIYSKETVLVDVRKRYKMSVRLRAYKTNNPDLTIRTLIGFATYDANGNLQSSSPGTHRYGVFRGTLLVREGWQTYTGIFEGVGDYSHHMFRRGTASVRPVLLLNYTKSMDTVTEVDWIKIKRID